jgi:hypothetical protein
MRPYPTNILEFDGLRAYLPTRDALDNFELYLEPEELLKYYDAPEVVRLQIHLSVNPFEAFSRYLEQGL